MTNSLRIHPSVATLAFESAYDVYDDFSGAALGPLNGRMPKIGPYSWSATGAGVAGAFAGAGSMGSSVTGSTYAVMQLPATPWEVGGVFESLTGTFSPTIAIIKDYANHGFSVMWHAKLNVASHLFTPGYWNDTWNGAGSTQVNVAAAWLTPANVANYTLAANTKYRYRLFFNAPYVDYVIETMAGLPIVNYRTYDSIVSSIIGPWVFFEVAGADTVWHEAYTRSKPVLNSARMVRAYGGLEGTHIGMNNPAPANVQSLQVGLASSTPVGVFSVSYAGVDADAPSIANTTSHGAFKIKAGTNGFAAELQVINGGGGVAKYQLDGSYNTSLIGNSGSAFLTKPANAGTPYFAAGVKVNGSGGVTQTDAASIPTSGSYTIGDFVWNKSPVVASGKVLLGWSRLTTGSAHVSGTDWSPVYGTVS